MPWRLIGIVVILGIFLLFIGFNLENNCNISLGFVTIEAVPVYLTAFGAFVFGLFFAVPFAIAHRRKIHIKAQKAAGLAGGEAAESKPEKKKWWKKPGAREPEVSREAQAEGRPASQSDWP